MSPVRDVAGTCLHVLMQNEAQVLAETRATWASVLCFLLGLGAGAVVLRGAARPLSGDGSVGIPVALIAGGIAAAAFVVSTFMHRRGETTVMPRWQALISDLSAVALTIAFAGVTGLGVLLGAEVLSVGVQGLELPMIGGAALAGVASAVGGRFAFIAGVGLQTDDLAALLYSYLVIGTLFAMLTAADPNWWRLNFSQLGNGQDAWAFNGTVIVAGLLVATVGAYIGRDLHRLRGDASIGRIAWVVVLWAATGIALASVGLFPLSQVPVLHNIASLATLVLFAVVAFLTTLSMPGPPRSLLITTVGVIVMIVVAVLLADPLHVYSITVLEVIVVGLGLLWLTTLVRALGMFVPDVTRPSARPQLLSA